MTALVDRLVTYLDASPSPFHAAANAAALLEAAGFTRVDEAAAWPAGGRHYLIRGGSLVAWSVPDGVDLARGFRIIGAHTDSPNLRVKPQPDTGRAGWAQVGIEVYGGPLLNSWLDRDLGLSGRVVVRGDGGPVERLLLVDRAVLRIPQLAVHLDRDVNVRGLILNPQDQLTPVWAVGAAERGGFRRFLAKELEVDEDAVLSWDVMTHDVVPAAVVGRDGEFLSSGRLDNLCSCLAAIEALLGAAESGAVSVVSLFDHEEIGSATARGADSPLLPTVLERIALRAGAAEDRDLWHRALAASVCVSVDMAHATHPNYPDRHDPGHWIVVNGGPVIKSNVNQRYATDGPGAAIFVEACERAGVPVQWYSHRNDLPCGSTIGPITAARLGITTVDVGAPQLAMHSIRELMGRADPELLARALTAFLT